MMETVRALMVVHPSALLKKVTPAKMEVDNLVIQSVETVYS